MLRLGHACAAIILLAACGQPPEPIEPKAEAATPARPTQATPTSAPPTMPPIAKRHDAKGKFAFATHWIAVLTYAVVSRNEAPLLVLSAPDCGGCNAYAERIKADRRAGVENLGFNWRSSRGSVLNDRVELSIDAAAYVRREEPEGQRRIPASTYKLALTLRATPTGWVVGELNEETHR